MKSIQIFYSRCVINILKPFIFFSLITLNNLKYAKYKYFDTFPILKVHCEGMKTKLVANVYWGSP